ncbi:hypothetical protein [Gloeothece verrucosa]|uniref:Uncharacterized protein n=1 Tax=Gloeothece verrucosa (strain PCC 7822) TaxID=497965 RepID=E0U985_GLOV7|nr:hypothetical protein [Gloeothece verrucosa]ADN17343.1 conserved hypothetical protein [Gloeothece verrucosa PCC 7822]
MTHKNLGDLLKKYPQLKNFLDQGKFLTGYTDGGLNGQTVNVFVFRCTWQHFCVQATAVEPLPPGEVLVITDSSLGNVNHDWKAYSLKNEKPSLHQSHKPSNLTSLAVEIAQQKHQNSRLSSRI